MAVAADVTGGPRFTWTPRCGATYLEVTTANRQQVMWSVQGDTGRVAPGVVYGVVPPTYRSTFGPLALVRGMTYQVRVGIMVDENSFAIFGEHTFVP